MMHAYDKTYLDKARTSLGRMLDFAVYDLHYDIEAFFHLFLTSGVSDRFETGDFTVLAGMSGVELAYEVLELSGIDCPRITPNYTINRSEEYWTGWALAYYQWYTALNFVESQENIVQAVTSQRLSVAGVDIDEEAMSLARYQEAYNLAAKVIAVMNETYDTLINTVM